MYGYGPDCGKKGRDVFSSRSNLEDVVESFKRYNTEYETIDTYFKTPFKHILREKWGECIANATEEFTKQGKCRCVSYKMVCHWVFEVRKTVAKSEFVVS